MPSVTRRTAILGTAASVLAARSRAEIVDLVVIGKDDWLFSIYDQVFHTDPAQLRAVTSVITKAAGVLKQVGIETVVCLTPAKSRIYRDLLPTNYAFDAASDARYASSLAMLRDGGALVPDLATVLQTARKTPADGPLFLKADTHWTGPGAEAAATELARQIKARLHLPASPQPGTPLGPLVVVRQTNNDLAEGLPPPLEARYGPESYKVHQVLQATAADALTDTDTADVLLVGNSFMQPKYGFAPMLSNQLGRPVSLLWKIHQSSPYSTLLAALNTDAFRQSKPKLLVWDFEETDMLAPTDQTGAWGQNSMKPQDFLARLRTSVGV